MPLESLLITIPFLPPSSNHIYVNTRPKFNKTTKKMEGGGRFLSAEARAFQKKFAEEVVPKHLAQISQLDRGSPYSMRMTFWFPESDILTRTFGQKNGASSLYKKLDLQNRVKLITDCLCKAIAIDDSQFFQECYEKRIAEREGLTPRVSIELVKGDVNWYARQQVMG